MILLSPRRTHTGHTPHIRDQRTLMICRQCVSLFFPKKIFGDHLGVKKIISLVFVRNKNERNTVTHSPHTLCMAHSAITFCMPIGYSGVYVAAIAFVGHKTVAACIRTPTEWPLGLGLPYADARNSNRRWTKWTKVWIWLRTCVEKFHFLWDKLCLGITAFGWRLSLVFSCHVCVRVRVPAIVSFLLCLAIGGYRLVQLPFFLLKLHAHAAWRESEREWHYICSIYQIKLTDTNPQESHAKWINLLFELLHCSFVGIGIDGGRAAIIMYCDMWRMALLHNGMANITSLAHPRTLRQSCHIYNICLTRQIGDEERLIWVL